MRAGAMECARVDSPVLTDVRKILLRDFMWSASKEMHFFLYLHSQMGRLLNPLSLSQASMC